MPSYSEHIRPILSKHCASCHQPNGVAPFPLLTYTDAKAQAPAIAAATRARRMPPWLPSQSDYEFADARRLSDRDLEVIRRWAGSGAVDGAATAPIRPAVQSRDWILGRPDLVLEMPAGFAVPARGSDLFRNFVLAVPVTETRYVRAVELHPGDSRVVHHVVVGLDSTNASRQQDAEDPQPGFDGMFARATARPPGGFFIGWTPGKVPRENAQGLAWRIDPGDDLVMQMHLRPHGVTTAIRGRIALYFTDQPPARTPVLIRLGSQTIDIPAGAASYTVRDSFQLPVDVNALGVYPHAHYLARVLDARAVLPNGATRQLLRIDHWDFNWQDAYTFADPVHLPAGTVLHLRYTYDNSTANPRNPQRPPRRVVYGPRSTDEMAELWLQAVPRAREDLPLLQSAIARKAARDAFEGWQHRVRVEPTDAVAHANLGSIYEKLGDAGRSMQHYRVALSVKPDFASVHYNLARLLEAQQADAAESHYRAALATQPDHAGARNNLGNLLLLRGRAAEAVTHLERAIALAPDQPEPHNNLGRALATQGRHELAIRHFQRAIALRPDLAPPYYNLGVSLMALGRTTDALASFERANRLRN